MSPGQRYRFLRAERHGGRAVAVCHDAEHGEVRVYFHRGRWRRWEVVRADEHVNAKLAAVARRGLGADEQLTVSGDAEPIPEPEPSGKNVQDGLFSYTGPEVPGQLTIGGD